jgi:metallo-beta-lactamase class B
MLPECKGGAPRLVKQATFHPDERRLRKAVRVARLALCAAVWSVLALSATAGPVAQALGAAAQHVEAARLASVPEFSEVFESLCVSPHRPPSAHTFDGAVRVFDNVIYIPGGFGLSAWVIQTSEGLIVIDPLLNFLAADIDRGLEALGVDPQAIKYVLISHGHVDHAGGAAYLQRRYGAEVVASAADWHLMDHSLAVVWKPRRGVVAADGHRLTLGDTTLTLLETPGHTMGTLSAVIPVRDQNTWHKVAYWGGTTFSWLIPGVRLEYRRQSHAEWFSHYIQSVERFRTFVADEGADVVLSNHTAFDGARTKLPGLIRRRPGEPHPYVIGAASVGRYFDVLEHCARAGLARVPVTRGRGRRQVP